MHSLFKHIPRNCLVPGIERPAQDRGMGIQVLFWESLFNALTHDMLTPVHDKNM